MESHTRAVSAAANKLRLTEDQVARVMTAYIEAMQKAGWSFTCGGLRLSVTQGGSLSLENMLDHLSPR